MKAISLSHAYQGGRQFLFFSLYALRSLVPYTSLLTRIPDSTEAEEGDESKGEGTGKFSLDCFQHWSLNLAGV